MKLSSADKLLDSAEAELIANGGQLEVARVAARAKVSVGLAYHHFGSKMGLISVVVDRFYIPLREIAFGDVGDSDLPWMERERQRTAALIDYYYDHPLAIIVSGRLAREPEVLDIEQSHMDAMLEEGTRNIMQGQRMGAVKSSLDAKTAIPLLLGGITLAIQCAIQSETRPSRETLLNQIWLYCEGALKQTD